jgi:hypothetical protein
MWALAFASVIAGLIASQAAWHHATRLDRQTEREMSPNQTESEAALALALGALLTAVAAAMLLQMICLPRLVQ